MCLLVFINEGVTPSLERLETASKANPHGFGFAVHDGNTIIRGRGMNFAETLERFLDIRKTHSGPALFHLRITTHGETKRQNCHPFVVGRDKRTVLAHNGMLPVLLPKGDTRSDSRYFAEVQLPSLGGVTSLDNKTFYNQLEDWSWGSKLVVLTADPAAKLDSYIINEQDGHWDEECWWSNKSYIKYPIITTTKSPIKTYATLPPYSTGAITPYGTETTTSRRTAWEWDDYEPQKDIIQEGPYCFEYECPSCWTKSTLDEYDYQCPNCTACVYCEQQEPCDCYDAYTYDSKYITKKITKRGITK